MTLYQRLKSVFSAITFKDIIESISGSDQDYTSGKIGRAMLLISIPMVLEMVMESVFALTDIFFVSKLGSAATATVGITESIMTIVYAVAMGLSVATSAVISRRIGERNSKQASVTAIQAIIITLIFSLIFAVSGNLFADDILIAMKASDDIIETGIGYTRIMLVGNMVIMLLFVINAIFRSAGDAAISFRTLAIANIINIALDPCLIFGWGPFPEMGIKGAAIATNIGRGIAVIYQLFLLLNGKLRIKIKWTHVKLKFTIIKNIIRLSLGSIMQNLIATSSWIFLIRILTGYGDTVVAGYTVAIRIVNFVLLPSWGLSNAASTLVGQNLGAKKPDRAEKSLWMCANANIVFLGIITIVLVLFPEFFIKSIVKDEMILGDAVIGLRYISYGFVMYGVGMVMMQSINGSGDTKTPTIANILCYWAFEVPVAILFSNYLNLGPEGVYIAILLAESSLTLIGYFLIKKGRWKLNVV